MSFQFYNFSAMRSSDELFTGCWPVLSFSRADLILHWQTLVAIMLGNKVDIGGELFISSAEATSAFWKM